MIRRIVTGLLKVGYSRRGGAMLAALERAAADCRAAQNGVICDITARAAHTEYGRTHGFSQIRDAADFQARVPVNTYEDLRPFIERISRSEADVLFAGRPIFYATTSGTTGAPKHIPITSHYHRTCWAGLTDLWLHSMFVENPGFMDGYDLSMVGKAVESHTADGTPCGSFSGHLNAQMPESAKRFRVIPFAVQDIDHYPSKYYTLLRLALACPLRWIVSPNPSTLLELHRLTRLHFSDIVRDIEQGTLKSDLDIPDDIRRVVEKRLRPDRARAAFLSRCERQHPSLLPRHYWPSLQVINTWTAGNAALYLRQTEGLYPDHTAIREFGYLATEARAGIILHNDQRASILAAHMLFFEFVRASELGSENPRFLLAHEVEPGENYGIFITTPGGLYRYNINDVVRVDGFFHGFPTVIFMHKGAGVTSLTGEKLSETQYLDAMTEASKALGWTAGFHIGFADPAVGGYRIFVESDDAAVAQTLDRLGEGIDASLSQQNPEYRSKRASGRLRPPRVERVPEGSWQRLKTVELRDGRREGQYKIIHLQQNDQRLQFFAEFAAEANREP